jgi:CheY-like chemotaxis protein
MGGEIDMTSRQGEGSTFWFTLRLPLDASAAAAEIDLGGMRVLVLDGTDVRRAALADHINQLGARHHEVGTLDEAVEALRGARAAGEPYHVAILDDAVGRRAADVATRARASDAAAGETQFVVLTRVSDRAGADRLRAGGIVAGLVTPIRDKSLRQVLSSLWAGGQRGLEPEVISLGRTSRDPVSRGATAQRGLEGARVLVAEDNAVNRKFAVRMLEKLGCRVDVAVNGREAVETLERAEYDLVLMDCQMPELDGYEATAEIRHRQGAGRRIPIIAMTAHAMQGDREKCLAAGMDDYIAKPVQRGILKKVLERWLREAGSPNPAEEDRIGRSKAA